jgi:hypothetical protein
MVLNPVNVLPMVVFLHDQSSDWGSVCQDNHVQLFIMARCSILLKNYCVKNAIRRKLRFEELFKHVNIHRSYTTSRVG